MRRKSLHLLVASTAVAVGLGAASAAAQAMTVTVGSPVTLTNRLLATVPITVTCDPWDATLTQFGSAINVTLDQAAGRAIAHGEGSVSGFFPAAQLYLCDGSPHRYPVSVQADTSGPPFHGGPAVANADAVMYAGIPCDPNQTFLCFYNQVSQVGGSGPIGVTMH